MKSKKFIPKIHLACGSDKLRPIMSHVLVTKKFIVATDAHILIEIPTNSVFTDEFISQLPERCLIHKNVWAQLVKAEYMVEIKDDIISYISEGVEYCVKIKYEIEGRLVFPNWKAVMPVTRNDIGRICIAPEKLKQIQNCIFTTEVNKSVVMEFSGETGAITIIPQDLDNKSKAILMPCMNC